MTLCRTSPPNPLPRGGEGIKWGGTLTQGSPNRSGQPWADSWNAYSVLCQASVFAALRRDETTRQVSVLFDWYDVWMIGRVA